MNESIAVCHSEVGVYLFIGERGVTSPDAMGSPPKRAYIQLLLPLRLLDERTQFLQPWMQAHVGSLNSDLIE